MPSTMLQTVRAGDFLRGPDRCSYVVAGLGDTIVIDSSGSRAPGLLDGYARPEGKRYAVVSSLLAEPVWSTSLAGALRAAAAVLNADLRGWTGCARLARLANQYTD